MSCDRNSSQTARAAIENGLSLLSSKKAFYAGVVAGAAGLVGGLVLARKPLAQATSRARARLKELARRSSSRGTTAPMIDPRRVPELSAGQIIAPTPREKLTEKCAGCGSSPRSKPGVWYVIDGKPHCQDCAPGAARQSKQRLQAPSAPRPAVTPQPATASYSRSLAPAGTSTPAGTSSRPARSSDLPAVPLSPERRVELTLQRRRVTLALMTQEGAQKDTEVDVYAALTRRGEETGLGLAQLEGKWTITHMATGMKVAGPYETQYEAQMLASVLAQLDWTARDPAARFGTDTSRRVGATIKYYNEAIEAEAQKTQTRETSAPPSRGQSVPAAAASSRAEDDEEDDEMAGLSPAERKAYAQVCSVGHDHGFAKGYDEGALDAMEELGLEYEIDPEAEEVRAEQQDRELDGLKRMLDETLPDDNDPEFWNATYDAAHEDGHEEGYWEAYEAVMEKFGQSSEQPSEQ